MFEIKDTVVLVTGGAAGIGAGVVKAFLTEGAKHVAILDLDSTAGKALETELTSIFGTDSVKFYKCDVTTYELIDAFDSVVQHFGYIDVVINCAGIMNDSPKMYAKSIAVNVTALITSSLKAHELMNKEHGGKGGTIVNIASIVALMKSPALPVYNATKSAVLQFSQCLGLERNYQRTGVRVVTLCFGCTDTALLTPSKAAVFENAQNDQLFDDIKKLPLQKTESAVIGLVEAYKKGASASTWLVTSNRSAEDITDNVNEAYRILSQGVYE